MGILDKMKNLFTEEVEEEIIEPKKEFHSNKFVHKPEPKEIKKEEKHVEIAPARKETAIMFETEPEEINIEIEEEKPVIVKEEKPLRPFYFSDEDFDDLPKKEVVQPKRPVVNKELYSFKKEEVKKEEPKVFKPSPIISPVYGVLDKNYSKEDIKPTRETTTSYRSEKITVDDVRNKAYGTLEDTVEQNLVEEPEMIDTKEESTINIFEELDNTNTIKAEIENEKKQIEEINKIIKTTVQPEEKAETSKKIDNILEELDEIEELLPSDDEVIDTKEDDVKESDLFNLIDSMYEKRDE